MQQRFVNAKTDVEDRIARLNQEIAVKDYINQKTSLEQSSMPKKDESLQELVVKKQQLEDLSKHHGELEAKSKADTKVLVKEVKSLRRFYSELKKDLTQLLTEKSETEKLQQERKLLENATATRKKLLSDCKILHGWLKDSVNLSIDEHGNFTEDSTSLPDALRLLSNSDNQIEEAQMLVGFDETAAGSIGSNSHGIYAEARTADGELRKIVADILAENAKLRMQVNSVMVRALKTDLKTNTTDNDEDHDDDKRATSTEGIQ